MKDISTRSVFVEGDPHTIETLGGEVECESGGQLLEGDGFWSTAKTSEEHLLVVSTLHIEAVELEPQGRIVVQEQDPRERRVQKVTVQEMTVRSGM